ncbi:MAG: choice-of-anchor tandem repeat GloVer-containing protein, partial [Terriglobales bacterium]
MLKDRFASALIVLAIMLLLAPAAWGQYIENTLYAFTGSSDGSQPLFGNLIFDAKRNLYGTASFGGDTSSANCGGGDGAAQKKRRKPAHASVSDQTTLGCGVIFELTPSTGGAWTETVLYTFTGGADGSNPQAGLVFDSAGNLYGTTYDGGAFGFGTVFELSPATGGTWTLTTLYTFTDGDDGAYSYATPVFDTSGNLYGTASGGGASGAGVVFQLTPTSVAPWTENVLYAFTGGSDGGQPETNVIFDSKGNLYGTASSGGSSLDGVVFELTPASSAPWTESVLYSFSGGADGSVPYGNVSFDTSGNLYGTTYYGGNPDCNESGCGVVYELTPTTSVPWTESVLYTFDDTSDGGFPDAGVTFDASGNLYSTASQGGTSSACDGACFGVVFKLTPASSSPWTESVLYTFTNGTDGNNPLAGVIFDSAGNLYGTTQAGGSGDNGVVFELSLPPTTTTLASSFNPSSFGQAVTFTATITPEAESVAGQHARHSLRVTPQTPTGTVAFSSNGTTITGCGGVSLSSSGTAQCTTSALPVGTDAIVATYSGDANYSGSSGDLSQVVNQVTTATVLASSLNPSTVDQSVALTATISPGTPTGTVGFTSNGATI